MEPDFKKRQNLLRENAKKIGLDCVLVTDPDDVYYYSGFYCEHSMLLVSEEPKLFVPLLENEAKAYAEVIFIKKSSDVFKQLGKFKKIGYDEWKTNAALFLKMKKFGITLKPLGDLIMKQRLVKDGYEIEQIKKALKITKVTLSKVAENMYGNTEKEVASEIEIEFKKHFSDPAFPTIVASGRNSTFIHHKPSEKIIKKNEPVLIDLGAKFNHYCSDFTRTFCSKNKDERKLYEDVLEIQRCLIEHIKPGVDFKEIQNLYSEFLRKNRYKKFHSFGHSVGLSTHETLKGEFKENMIITVEPGVYLSNFGCRIEDMILIRKGKAKIL